MRRRLPLLLLCRGFLAPLALCAALPAAFAVEAQQLQRPADEPLATPAFLDEVAPAELALPESPPPMRGRLSSGLRVDVRAFRVVGSTVFDEATLRAVTAPWTGRRIGSEELLAARDAVTRLYVDRGYVSSGAVLPDQDVRDGVIEIRVVEGRLGEVSVRGARWFRSDYLRGQVRVGRREPVNVIELERELQRIQQDVRVERIDARLLPGERRDRSRLTLDIEERSPWILELRAANDVAPSLGGRRAELSFGHRNLSGRADELRATIGVADGLDDLELRYGAPVGPWGTRLELRFRQSRSRVSEGDIADLLKVRSRLVTWSARLRQPLWQGTRTLVEAGLSADVRRSLTRVEGERLCFELGGLARDGRCEKLRLTVLRPYLEWIQRSRTRVLAARLTTSFGIDALRATRYDTERPGSQVADGRFVAWLLQLQFAQRLPERFRGAQLLGRLDLQWTRDPLLSVEQIAIGGGDSVRGYHENELVRENGLDASLELRIPVLRDPLGRDLLQAAPFVDFGKAWNRRQRASLQSISSVGLGLRYRLREHGWLSLYWASRLRAVDDRDGDDLQDHGLHVAVELSL